MAFKIDASGFRCKIKGLRSLTTYMTQVNKDAAAYLLYGLVNRVIDFQYVRVITGQLRRSHDVLPITAFQTAVFSNLSIAPYQPYVANWSEGKYGRNFYAITLELFGSATDEGYEKEFNRAVKVINDCGQYRYRNPFPAFTNS